MPVFAYTTVYKKRRLLKRPKKVVYIDGPFFAEGGSVKERAHALRDKVYAAMCERAKLSDCAYCEYIKAEDARLAATLNAERGRARGKKMPCLPEGEEELPSVAVGQN